MKERPDDPSPLETEKLYRSPSAPEKLRLSVRLATWQF